MMIENRSSDYKAKFYKLAFIFVIIILECLFLLFFVSNESKKANTMTQNIINQITQAKQKKEMILKSLTDFKNFNKTWDSIDKSKIQPSKQNTNDIIIFLSSTAKKLGIINFVVEVADQSTKEEHYSTINAKVKFTCFNEPSILLLINTIITTSQYQIFLKNLTIEKNIDNKAQQINKVALSEFENKLKDSIEKLRNGERYQSLPELLKANMEIEVLFVR